MGEKIEALQANTHMNKEEISAHLIGVEYIMMAAPAIHAGASAPIHFTIFLNTQEALPQEIFVQVFEKFTKQYHITKRFNVFHGLEKVGFAQTNQDSPMPMHLFTKETQENIPYTSMYIIDFEGDSPDFEKAKNSLTGWTYSYEQS